MTRRKGPEQDRRLAVALEYTGEGAPRVTAKGAGAVADEIVRLAEENDVPLRPDRDLVEVLARLDLNQEIPQELYRAVAEVIAFAHLIKGKTPGDRTPRHAPAPPDPPPSG